MKKLLVFILMVVTLTVPVYAKKVPVKIGSEKITYKHGKIVRITYPGGERYKVSYKGNKVIIKRLFESYEQPLKTYYTYKKGKIVRESYKMNENVSYTTKIKYKKGKMVSTKTTTNGLEGTVITGKIKCDKRKNMVKATFKVKDNTQSWGTMKYSCKNKYKKKRIISQKIKVHDKVYGRDWKYTLRNVKYKYKNIKMSKKKYRKAMAIVRYFNMPIYQGGI